jgi:hypothetical protein
MQNFDPQNQPQNPFPSQNPYQPSANQGYQAPPQTDGFAITSMVLGIIAVITCYFGAFPGIIAVIFGHLSLSKMKRDPLLGGKGMAVAGLVTGYIGIAVSIVFGIMLLFAVNTTNEIGKGLSEVIEQQMELEKERIKAEQEAQKERSNNETNRELLPNQE